MCQSKSVKSRQPKAAPTARYHFHPTLRRQFARALGQRQFGNNPDVVAISDASFGKALLLSLRNLTGN